MKRNLLFVTPEDTNKPVLALKIHFLHDTYTKVQIYIWEGRFCKN